MKSESAAYNHYQGELSDRFKAQPGDLLFAWSGTPGTSFGAHIWGGPEAWVNQHIFRVDFSEDDFDRDFLKLALDHNLGDYIAQAQGGVGLAHITKAKLGESLLVHPPVPVQKAIGDLIGHYEILRTSAIKQLKAARNSVGQLRRAVLAAACSGRLTADWREGRASGESALDLINRSKESLKSTGRRLIASVEQPDYLDIPESWEWAPLGWLAAIKGGIQKQPKRTPKGHAFPYLRVANVLRGHLDLTEMHRMELFEGELETYRLESGDLLVVEGNGSLTEIGRSALWAGQIADCVHQNHIIRVRCLKVDSEYVNIFWNSPLGSQEIADLAVTSAGLYNLSVGKVSAFPVPLPPLEEQREIVRRVRVLMDTADDLMSRIDRATKAVDNSSRAVLAKAFRGELVRAENVA